MLDRRAKWKNWWWYHKTHVLIAAAAAAILLYSFLPGLLAPKPDYDAAVITRVGLPDETCAALKDRLEQAADDRNGDGKVLVELHCYTPDLSGETEGTENYQEAARLDADLVGKVSRLFLIEDTEGFRKNVAISVAPGIPVEAVPLFDGIPLPEGTVFTVRTDSDTAEFQENILRGLREVLPEQEKADLPVIKDVVQLDGSTFSCTADGVRHRFILDFPEEYSGAPLVVMLPGYGNSAESFRTAVHFEAEANALGYAVVYVTGAPDPGSPTSAVGWHAELNTEGNRDVEFLVSLVNYLRDEYALDPERAYAVGFSNGAAMTHTLAAEAGDTFSAVVSVAGLMQESVWASRRAVSETGVFQITGEKDQAVPKNSDGSAQYAKAPAIEDVMAYWAESNGLELQEEKRVGKDSVLSIYAREGKLQQVWNLSVKDGRHSWPGMQFNGIDTNAMILAFIEAQK